MSGRQSADKGRTAAAAAVSAGGNAGAAADVAAGTAAAAEEEEDIEVVRHACDGGQVMVAAGNNNMQGTVKRRKKKKKNNMNKSSWKHKHSGEWVRTGLSALGGGDACLVCTRSNPCVSSAVHIALHTAGDHEGVPGSGIIIIIIMGWRGIGRRQVQATAGS